MRKRTVFGITMLLLVLLMGLMPAVKATVYCWDGIRFVEGYEGEWIKYPHPDRNYYDISPYSTKGVDGNKLHHCQVDQAKSLTIIASVDALCTGLATYLCPSIGYLVGAALSAIITYVSAAYFLDEDSCIWFWTSLAFIDWLNANAPMLWVKGLTDPAGATALILSMLYVTGYLRVGAITFLDAIGRGNPTPEPNLRVLAQDQYGNSLTTGDVYIDGQWRGLTGQSWLLPMDTTHTVRTNDFWEAGATGYRYGFTNWDGSTSPNRTVTLSEPTTVTAYFNKKYDAGDCNGDGVVNELDVAIVSAAYLSVRGSSKWDSRADVTGNEVVDLSDITCVALYYDYCYLTVLAEDLNGNSVTTGYVYIDGKYMGRTGLKFTVVAGTRKVFVDNVCWGSGNFAGYRYVFQYWAGGSTANPRTMWLDVDTTTKAYFKKKWCPADVDGSGVVDWIDQGLLGMAYESKPADSNWNSAADLDASGTVDWVDLAILGQYYNWKY